MSNSSSQTVGLVVAVIVGLLVKTLIVEYRTERAFKKAMTSIEDGTAVNDLGYDLVNPYEFVRKRASAGGDHFRRNYVAGTELTLRREEPGAKWRFDELADIEDFGSAMRGIVRYEGQLPLEDNAVESVTGEVRQYFHKEGMVIVEALCLKGFSTCEEMPTLVSDAERRLLLNLEPPSFKGVLPTGECDVELMDFAHIELQTRVLVCWYDPATLITLMHMDLVETRRALNAAFTDPDLKELMRGSLQEMRR